MPFIDRKYSNLSAAIIILISGIIIFATFPADNMYYRGADEGNYYRQAHLLLDKGFGGFKAIADTFINTPALHDSPHPLRPAATILMALFLLFHDSFSTLSFLSLVSFMALLAATYVFISRYWNHTLALFTILLMAFSPLAMDMGHRALTDSLAFTGIAFSIFAFFYFMERGTRKSLTLFIACFSMAILIKETEVLLLPFFILVYVFLKPKSENAPKEKDLLAAIFLPLAICAVLYILLYGWTNVIAIIDILRQPSAYSALYGQGPWYRYLVDYLMLSPFTLILAIGAIGYLFLSKNFDKKTGTLIALAIYLLIVYSFLSKNVRYCLLLDLPIRFLAAYFLWIVYNNIAKLKWMPIAALLLISAVDCTAYYSYFVTGNIYDTISLNLLSANHIIPSAGQAAPAITVPSAPLANPKAIAYIDSSLQYYNAGAYQKSIDACMQALRIDSNSAVAYNNICSAYNQLHEWDKAIAAGNKALQIDPGFTLAQNNVNWAKQQMNTKGQ